VGFRSFSNYFLVNYSHEEKDYNIVVSTYVAQKDTREVIDIKKLNAEIKGIVARQNDLRKAIDEIVADLEGSHG
jgi:type I restriction enzyme M protein